MKRWMPVATLVIALALVAVPACTRTVVKEVPVASPAVLGSPVSGDEPIIQLVERVRPAVVNVDHGHDRDGVARWRGQGDGDWVHRPPRRRDRHELPVVEGAQRITVITPSPDARSTRPG